MLVLLVEDEPLVREDLRDSLEEAGHEVLTAADGEQAMDGLIDSGSRIEALVTDIRLPRGPDGWGIAKRARAMSPEMLVLYITGAADHEWGMHSVAGGRMLEKPFDADRMIKTLAELQGDQGRRISGA